MDRKFMELVKGLDLRPRELSKTLSDAADILAPDDFTKKKILVGMILGGTSLATLWLIRKWQNWQEEHKSGLGFIDWVFFRPDE